MRATSGVKKEGAKEGIMIRWRGRAPQRRYRHKEVLLDDAMRYGIQHWQSTEHKTYHETNTARAVEWRIAES